MLGLMESDSRVYIIVATKSRPPHQAPRYYVQEGSSPQDAEFKTERSYLRVCCHSGRYQAVIIAKEISDLAEPWIFHKKCHGVAMELSMIFPRGNLCGYPMDGRLFRKRRH